MPMFHVDNGRAVVVHPIRPAAQAFGESSRALAEHLDALFGEHLLPVKVRSGPEDEPYLLAVDASGHPLVVEVVAVLDESTLVRALRHTGRVARMSLGELGARYPAGSERFAADLARFRDAVPIATLGASAPGARLLLVCSEYAAGMDDVVEALTQPGRGVDVLQIGVLESADGPQLLDVSPARRAAAPSVPTGPVARPAWVPEPVTEPEPDTAPVPVPVPVPLPVPVPEPAPEPEPTHEPSGLAQEGPPSAAHGHLAAALSHGAHAGPAPADVQPSSPTDSPAVGAIQPPPAAIVGGVPTRISSGVRIAMQAVQPSNGRVADGPVAPVLAPAAVARVTSGAERDAAGGSHDAGHRSDDAPRRAPVYGPDARLVALASVRGGAVVLVWWRQRRGVLHEALLREDGSIELADGTRAMDPSAAAEIASGAHVPVDGWRVWRLESSDGVPLADAVSTF